MRAVTRFAHLFILAFVLTTSASTARTWTDVDGRKVEATFVSATDEEVTIKLANGKVATIPLARLSEKDQEYVIKAAAQAEDEPTNVSETDEDLNFDDPWPSTIRFSDDPEIIVAEEDADEERFVYESRNYRFVSDVRLSKQVVKGFAIMFEATHDYCRALPLAISGGGLTDGKYQILLFETKESYIKAGGPPTSAGVFIGGRNVVMVPLTSLGVKPVGSGYMLDRDQSSGTLIHEITHQLTPFSYFEKGARGWFSEGIAEYTTATPYRAGRFKVKSNFDDIVDYATAYGSDDTRGRALGESFKAPALSDYMLMSYENFTGANANFNYGFALILTTYFLHLDGDGDAAQMKEFLKALRAGKRGQEAIDILFGGRSYSEMQDAISKAWKRKGVEIEFADSTSSGE